MNRFVFLLGFLLMALMTVTLQAQKIIPLWQNNMPNSKGIVLKDSVVRERVVQVGIPAVHVYEPSKAAEYLQSEQHGDSSGDCAAN